MPTFAMCIGKSSKMSHMPSPIVTRTCVPSNLAKVCGWALVRKSNCVHVVLHVVGDDHFVVFSHVSEPISRQEQGHRS